MKLTSIIATVAITVFLPSTLAYILDDGCRDHTKLIDDAVNNAVAMASDAYDELNRRPWTLPADKPYSDLGLWVLKDDGTTGQQPPPLGEVVDLRPNLNKAKDLFWAVQSYAYTSAIPNDNEIRIYCDLERFLPSEEHQDKVWNKITRKFQKLAVGLKSTCGVTTMAYTAPGAEDEPWEIQICPGYLKKMASLKYTTAMSINAPVKPDLLDSYIYRTSMDAYSLLDSTMLHEFFHTKRGGILDDLDPPYGWRNVVEKTPANAIRNADNMMYFALGVRMIKRQNLLPQLNGDVAKR